MNAVNDLDTPTGQREYKAFATLAAQYAMQGIELIKGDPAIEGQARYYAMRWGAVVRPLAGLDDARDYLARLQRARGVNGAGGGHGQSLQAQ